MPHVLGPCGRWYIGCLKATCQFIQRPRIEGGDLVTLPQIESPEKLLDVIWSFAERTDRARASAG